MLANIAMVFTDGFIGETATTPLLPPGHRHLLKLAGTNLQTPIWDQLNLVAAVLSGTYMQKDCHHQSARSSAHHRDLAHELHTIHPCNDG